MNEMTIKALVVGTDPEFAELLVSLADQTRHEIETVQNTIQAVKLLRREDNYSEAIRPNIIMIDWLVAGHEARDMLRTIKADPGLKSIPVVFLASSEDVGDIAEAYDLHACCYVSKPQDLSQLKTVVTALADFWLRVVRLPSEY
jgi:CheY-like chemotaxis protein